MDHSIDGQANPRLFLKVEYKYGQLIDVQEHEKCVYFSTHDPFISLLVNDKNNYIKL